jgi:leucyl aminopeptidase
MTVTTTTDAPVDLDVDLLLVPVAEPPADSIMNRLAGTMGAPLPRAARDVSGAAGETQVVYPQDTTARRVALVGIGAAEDRDVEALRVGMAAGAKVAHEYEADRVACLLPEEDTIATVPLVRGLVEGFVMGAYRYRRYKTDDDYAGPSSFVVRVDDERSVEAVAEGAEEGHTLAAATGTARDLVNCSPNDKTAELLATEVQSSGEAHGYEVDVWDEERIRAEGMGGLLAVNQGSFEPPTFSVLEWAPSDAVNEKPVVVAGKGVVYDTGGLSLKDTKGSMDKMKSDMAGAAAVVGLFEALADLAVPLRVVGLLPSTDNRPGRTAYVPGDVIEMHSGKTVEVMNTDAEGRLLLADALSYASDTYDPELMVDLATLTGSCIVALGSEAAGVMAPETDRAAERLYALQRAGERTGERVHPLPMYEDYAEQLESDVADRQNVGGPTAGAITAAKFLEAFADAPWMHLDIAGPAFRDEPDAYRPAGGTGFGVRLMTNYLRTLAAAHASS